MVAQILEDDDPAVPLSLRLQKNGLSEFSSPNRLHSEFFQNFKNEIVMDPRMCIPCRTLLVCKLKVWARDPTYV